MNTRDYVVGVDGGASKTLALVGTTDGVIVGRGETGPSNYHNVGPTVAGKAIKNAVLQAKDDAGLNGIIPKTAVVALAAVDSSRDRHVASRFVRRTGISKASFVIHDSVAALYAATQGKPGIIVISGTGCVAAGINESGRYARVGGWGCLVDDEGSAYDVGRKALTAAFRSADGRAERTKLTGILKRRFKTHALGDILNTIYTKGWDVEKIASLAPLVSTAANSDTLCRDILKHAGTSLAELAVTAAKRLRMQNSEFPLAIVGGNFKSGRFLLRPFASKVKLDCPRAKIRMLDVEPAEGAFWLAAKSNSPILAESRKAKDMFADFAPK